VLIRIVAAIALVVIGLNVAGVLRYPGGPLRDPSADGPLWLDLRPADQGGIEVGSEPSDMSAAGRPIYFGTLALSNPWPYPARIEAITPVDPTAGLVIDHVWLGRPADVGAVAMGLGPEPGVPPEQFDEVFQPLPFEIEANVGPDRAVIVLIELHADAPGGTGFRSLAVDYRVGPASFHVVQPYMLALCLGPLDPGQECGWPWPRQSDR